MMKKIVFLLFVFLPSIGWGGEFNEKYSYKNFMNQKFTTVDPKEFNNTEIVGSCFYQLADWDADALGVSPKDPMIDVFPIGMTGVVFKKCNLDNVKIPKGNTVSPDCTHKRVRIQNDHSDWILDVNSKPVEPLDKPLRERAGITTSPLDIPTQKWTDEQRKQFNELLEIK